MLFLIGLTVTCFLEILLISKKNKSVSDKIMVVWLLFLGLHLLLFDLRYNQTIYSFPYLLGFDLPFPLLHGPFLLFYTMSLTNRLPKQKYKLLVHFIPAILSYLLFLPYFLLPENKRIEVYMSKGVGFETSLTLNFVAIIILSILYFSWSLLLLNKYSKSFKDNFSAPEKINFLWLRYLIYGLGCIYLISFLFNEMYIFIALVVFVNLLGYLGIKRVGIFVDNLITSPENKPKYEKSGLSDDKAETTYHTLMKVMKEEELFTSGELTLSDLADKLKIHPNYLSQIINEKTSGNFYAFINNLRIEKFLTLIKDPKNKNIKLMALAYDCGFNSKSSFNKYFKNKMGQTPTEYMKTSLEKGE